ncbi:MAG: polysaccharide deacetylase family protein [Bacilli bacterium]|nr:polysaccharide deacetylase family protein [Bacilli bacterium]MDD4718560.1 polysaccharide deacetylase family protein [Bacilli bacterium]
MKKRKPKYINILIAILIVITIVFSAFLFLNKEETMIDLKSKTVEEIREYAKVVNLKLEIKEEHNKEIDKGKVINQSIEVGTKIKKDEQLVVIISLGKLGKDYYSKYKVDESGNVPIMMYHGIHNLKNEDTAYTGGNIDKDGYQRTAEAFIKDLDFYYDNNYRLIKLNDYINGIIDVEIGKSPIIITFDDGLKNNIRVTGLDDKGEIVIDPNSAVGIMESFKQKHPDFNITATFFLNGGLFEQGEYNEKIINWLINNGYDVGNHSYGHSDFTKIDETKAKQEIGRLYNLLDEIIKDKYVNIVALPFGSPYDMEHKNFKYILKGKYENHEYETKSTLRVGWESELSPFNKNFNPLFLKRIRAYDNLGNDFDIEHNFKILEKNRYISDGDKTTVVIPEEKAEKIKDYLDLELIKY